MKNAQEIADKAEVTKETIYFHAKKLGIKSENRRFRFKESDVRRILSRIGARPGPKPKRKPNIR